MQRSALGVVVSAVAMVGLTACHPPTGARGLGRLPDPVLITRAPPPPVQATPRAIPEPTPPPHRPAGQITASSEWTPPGGIRKGLWKAIIVHHSATAKSTPESMDRYHRDQLGWQNGLGYHFVIGNGVNYPDGKVYVGMRWKEQMHGAHCRTGAGRYCGRWYRSGHFNDHGIGICLIGNFEKTQPTAAQLKSLSELLAFLCDRTGISPDEIYGHGEVTHKTACPGKNLDIRAIRRSAQAALNRRSKASYAGS